jgi:hypothetical protein
VKLLHSSRWELGRPHCSQDTLTLRCSCLSLCQTPTAQSTCTYHSSCSPVTRELGDAIIREELCCVLDPQVLRSLQMQHVKGSIPVGNAIDVWRMCLRVTFSPPKTYEGLKHDGLTPGTTECCLLLVAFLQAAHHQDREGMCIQAIKLML